MKFGIIATTVYLLTESTHAQLAAAARPKRRQRRGLKNASNTKKTMHHVSESDARLSPKTRMLEDTSFSMFAVEEMRDETMNDYTVGAPPPMAAKSSKSSSSSKSGKSHKTKALTAILGPAPELPGSQVSGTVTVRYNSDGHFLMSLDAASLDPACADGLGCKMAIKTGMSCDEATVTGDDYYTTSGGPSNPWENPNTKYSTYDGTSDDVADFSNSASRVSNGYGMEDNAGHAVVLYIEGGNTPYACGVLEASGEVVTLEAEVGTYPGYNGELEVTGKIEVVYETDQTFKYKYSLSGLAADCEGCGIHIHKGKSCASNEAVMGHGWNSERVQDLWTNAGGAVYNSDSDGNAEGYFNTYNGFSIGQNMGHAVVVHTAGGSRVGCGVLQGIIQ